MKKNIILPEKYLFYQIFNLSTKVNLFYFFSIASHLSLKDLLNFSNLCSKTYSYCNGTDKLWQEALENGSYTRSDNLQRAAEKYANKKPGNIYF